MFRGAAETNSENHYGTLYEDLSAMGQERSVSTKPGGAKKANMVADSEVERFSRLTLSPILIRAIFPQT